MTNYQSFHFLDNFLCHIDYENLYHLLNLSWTQRSYFVTKNMMLTVSLHLNQEGEKIPRDGVFGWLL